MFQNVCWSVAQVFFGLRLAAVRTPNVLWCRSESFDTSCEIRFLMRILASRQPASLPFEQLGKSPGEDTIQKGCQKSFEDCPDLKHNWHMEISLFVELSAKSAKTMEGKKMDDGEEYMQICAGNNMMVGDLFFCPT